MFLLLVVLFHTFCPMLAHACQAELSSLRSLLTVLAATASSLFVGACSSATCSWMHNWNLRVDMQLCRCSFHCPLRGARCSVGGNLP